MESHILNMYHQTPYRTIGHKIMRSMSESLSSEGSCNQNSPEYAQERGSSQYEEESNEGEYWDPPVNNLWSQNQKINITQSQDSSIDEDENIDVQEISIDEKTIDSSDHEVEADAMEENSLVDGVDHEIEADSMEDNSLVEGADYDVIQVFAVDPDIEFECSSEEEEQDEQYENTNDDSICDGEYSNIEQKQNYHEFDNQYGYRQNSGDSICQDNLGINLDTPVVSNVDEYFIKENKDILEVKDEPVVKDVDEYFIKNVKEPTMAHESSLVDDLLIATKSPEEPDFRIEKENPNVEEFFISTTEIKADDEVIPQIVESVKDIDTKELEPEVPLNEADLVEVLPNIEDLKRYLLEDIPYNKLKSVQRSCSVPHSPMHNICLDIDAKTCLSFEDLNLDLSDLSFENDKDKSHSSSKSDDIPRTLTDEDVNSFLITTKSATINAAKEEDDLNPQDMEIDRPIESIIDSIEKLPISKPATPPKATKAITIKPTVLDFCIEKTSAKKVPDVKTEADDFVDVESCNETVIPVLEANNLNSLLEQFEATEKLNTKSKNAVVNVNEQKVKGYTSLTNGMRLQDAGVQLTKNKMRQILMPSTINTTITRSPSPVHSDHDYCSMKKRHSLPNIKGRSLLKPEVLSSNNRILSSRHRSCKNKKIIYHQSSDEESEKCNDIKKNKCLNNRASDDDSDIKKKTSAKQPLKTNSNINYRKKVSPVHFASNDSVDKSNGSVMVKNASKASDTASSQNSNGSIKLTIKNKSEVIIKNCDSNDNHKIKIIEKHKSSSNNEKPVINNVETVVETTKILEVPKNIVESELGTVNMNDEESKPEDFYATLFTDKKDVQMPQNIPIKSEKRSHDDDSKISPVPLSVIEVEQPQKKKKLNLQEYKLRRGVTSNNSSAQVSPEAIFPEMPCNINLEKVVKTTTCQKPTSDEPNAKISENSEGPKKIFDPIREASRKILMNTKKQKAEAMRKRDEDIVMSKIPKVENLELQPLISDAEMLKIVGMSTKPIIPISIPNEIVQPPSKDYDEIILVSVGTNTDEDMFKQTEIIPETRPHKTYIPTKESKATINFKIRKSDTILKHNVFDSVKEERNSTENKKTDIKIDEERFKDITATLKSVGKQVDTKISSNSLFASIQDVVMKKAPTASQNNTNAEQKQKPKSPVRKHELKFAKPIIVREYDEKAEHGEDKIILHLEKNRKRPDSIAITIQTDSTYVIKPLTVEINMKQEVKEQSISPRKRNDSDMSMSSEGSPVRKQVASKSEETVTVKRDKPKLEKTEVIRDKSPSKEKRSRSKERHEVKYRRSRSHSRGHRRKRSRSRTRSRSRGRFRRYRRSDSPYRRKRRSRSPYRSRRSPSARRDYRPNRSRSRSRYADTKSKSPIKKKPSPQKIVEKKLTKSLTPPIRKPTVSESSDTSTSSSSSSSSSSSASSTKSRSSSSTFKKNESRKKAFRKSFSPEDREINTPVEERRIVFVGRLELDTTKASLRSQFSKFGPVTEVRLHSKEDGTRYGFVTFQRPRDAWSAVEAAATFPQYDVGFGGRRAFCRQSYADLDGLEAKYTESAFHGQAAIPARRSDDMSFEQMLLDIKRKMNKRKGDKKPDDSA